MTTLGALFTISEGLRRPALPAKLDGNGGRALVIDGRAIAGGQITLSESVNYADAPQSEHLRLGDLLLRALRGPGALLEVAAFASSLGQAVAGSNVVVLRPNADTSEDARLCAEAFLRSKFAARLSEAFGSGSMRITVRSLQRIQIPVPDADMGVALRDLHRARARLKQWTAEIDGTIADLFDQPAASNRTETLRAGHRVRDRIRAAERTDDLSFRIRSNFPHPVAFRWRTVEAAAIDGDGYKQVLEAAETTLLYAASLALLTSRELKIEVRRLHGIAVRISTRAGGTTMGDWGSLLTDVQRSSTFKSEDKSAPVPELAELWRSEEAQQTIKSLCERRNDLAHNRGPSKIDLPSAFADARAELERLLEGAAFFAEYPLRFIESTRWRAVDEVTEYEYRELRGDHPLTPLERSDAKTHRIETGSLYLASRTGSLFRLSPYLVRRMCPHCRSAATFVLDRWVSGNAAPSMRTLEHGHSVVLSPEDDSSLVAELQSAGLTMSS